MSAGAFNLSLSEGLAAWPRSHRTDKVHTPVARWGWVSERRRAGQRLSAPKCDRSGFPRLTYPSGRCFL